ncbi:hypothetical protein QC761_608790 [Podospora bellae-mahoneyi]|uniref:Uncharacterized protein n=1 Tax=Podospora bellae-mahoneyi TaxID=2093777 RepID=A0ABR0FBI1_9PEZI|nr:hypothetical protein QC761_608790 [Podospora bellae-mahoneyi]
MVQEQEAAVTWKKEHGPKYVILVGGFGRSRYLFSHLKKKLGDKIEILQSRGASPWTAICCGAVIQSISSKGRSNLSIDVQGRISRASCGVRYSATWDPKVHDASLRYFCHYDAGWRAKGRMCWYLNQKGDLVNSDKRITSSYLRHFDTNDDQKQTIVEAIYCTTASQPPKVWNDQVKTLYTVKWETKIYLTTLPTFTNPVGKVIYILKYGIEMTVAGGILDFAV